MKNRVLLCLVLVLSITGSLSAKNYYVSAAGNNNNEGLTPGAPWQTISKVNSYFASMSAGDSILFRRGDVFYGSLIVGKSGTSALPIAIDAYGTGAKPVISGFITVPSTSWVSVGNGIYQALVSNAKPALNMVTINNVPQALGRYPNIDAANGGFLSYEAFSGTTSITDNEMDAGTNWVGAEIVVRKKLWVLDRCPITAQSGGTFTFTNTISGVEPGTVGFGYFIQKDPRTLDKFGEWYYNKTTKYLQVYFGTAVPSSYTIKASGIDTLLYIGSKNYVNVKNIGFDGANADAILGNSSSYVNIVNCDFTNCGTNAFDMVAVSNLTISNCTTNNMLSYGIYIYNSKTNNVAIQNCAIKNTGVLPGMGQSGGTSYGGIYAYVGSNLLVEYNKVDTTGCIGISFQGSNVTIKNNVVNYFDFIKDDGGGIYSYASGTDANPGPAFTNRVVTGNIVMNGIGAPYGRSNATLYASGIYLDGRTMNVDVVNNTLFSNAKNGIHCNNPNNIVIRGNTSYNNLNAMSIMRWANIGLMGPLNISNNIFYPKQESHRSFYYTNNAINDPVTSTVNDVLQALGTIDSNYYSNVNQASFNTEFYSTYGGARVVTSPLSLEGWRAAGLNDNNGKKAAKLPVTYKINSLIGANKFTNGMFASTVSGVTVNGTGVAGAWDNTGKINGGSLKITFSNPVANTYGTTYAAMGAVSAAKKYLLRFSTYGTTQQGVVRGYIRKTSSPYTALTPIQTKSFGTGRKDHEFLFAAPTTDAGGSFVIEVEQNSGITYLDNIEFYEVDATLYDFNSQLRFEYNDTKVAKLVSLNGGRYTGVDGTVYTGSVTLQPFTSLILVQDTGALTLAATAIATTIKCFGDSATVTVAATAGTTPYTGVGTFKVPAGTYTYTVRDAAGASSTATVTVTQPAAALVASATAGSISILGGSTSITVSATGGTAPYTGTGTFTILAGTYTYTITDANGCTSSVTKTILDGTAPSYTLSVTSSPTAGGTVTGAGTYTSGATATLTATPATGYTFSSWSGSATGTTNPVTVAMTANKTVTATFTAVPTYTLTATASPTAGGTVTGTGTYTSGATATLTATPAAGYVFSGWSGSATGTTNPVTVSMTANKTVTATFTAAATYTLTAMASPTTGGTITGAGTYASGATATLTATPATGYTFSGWSGAATGTTNPVTVSMTANKTVTATFTPITYTLTTTASPTAGGTVVGAGTYAYGATATLTATPATGYVFTGWSGAVTGTATTVTVSMTANKSVTATFAAVTMYTLTTIATPASAGTVSGAGDYESGVRATVIATPATGYEFSGWTGATTGISETQTVLMNGDKTVTAIFKPLIYALTATASPTAGGTVSGAGSYTYGTTATLTATPAAGYRFTGWSGAVTGTATTVTVLIDDNKAATANFALLSNFSLTATASPTAGGTITGAGSYASGATATLTATPATGYTFSGWSGAVSGTTNPVTVSMTANKSVTATFTAINYTLTATASPTAGGTITGAGTYAYGSTATLTATPAAGYTFTGWSGAAIGTATTVSISMNANKSVVANFALLTTYTLTATASPTAGGTITGAGTYTTGATATLTATPAAGYTFTGWSGAVTGTATTVTVAMTANKSVVANFTLSVTRYTLTVIASPTAGGTITGAGAYNSGTTATLTATPAAGYTFTGWSGAVTGTTNPITVSMTANKSVTATFAAATRYTLTATASPTAGGIITGAGSYNAGTTATLMATPADGYTFTGWSGAVTGTANPATVLMNASKAVTATFVAETTVRIEDDLLGTTGLCSIDGSISNNSGANNSRSVNLSNSLAKGLDWNVNAGAAGTYKLKWRYANGSTSNTYYMKLIINGVAVEDSVPFPKTTGSSSFLITADAPYQLIAGNNTIRLESIEARATADIDWMEITGYEPAANDCGGIARPAASATTALPVLSTQKAGVYPSPASGNINIGVNVPETQKVSFVILDAAGNPVANIKGQVYMAGYNAVPYNMAGKTPGIYTVMVSGDRNMRLAYKFMVSH